MHQSPALENQASTVNLRDAKIFVCTEFSVIEIGFSTCKWTVLNVYTLPSLTIGKY